MNIEKGGVGEIYRLIFMQKQTGSRAEEVRDLESGGQ